jgi:NAD+ kinase
MKRILFVIKVPLVRRLADETVQRLHSSGAMSEHTLRESADRHQRSIELVRKALQGFDARERRVHELRPDDAEEADLVVTAGGDGTVFTANTLNTRAPFLTVNSDPQTSLGHFTRARAEDVPRLLDAWTSGRAAFQDMPRLRCTTATVDVRILNDALFTNQNPAAMSRYLIDDGSVCEKQRSSGVWISTGAGSTAGIHSAGMDPVFALQPALLFKVREPFQAFGRINMLAGRQLPPRLLRLTASVPGMALYLDGPNITVPLAPGEHAEFSAAPDPLRLLVG